MAILRLAQTVAPVIEPVTLAEAKAHMRVDSGSIGDDITVSQCIIPNTYAPSTTTGSAVDVSNTKTLVILNAGTVSGTLDVKLKDGDTSTGTFTDVSGSTFARVSSTNDNATYELEYTGTKRYIRANAVIGTTNATFTVNVTAQEPTASDDSLITTLITVARQNVENILNISIQNQTWTWYLDDFPTSDDIWLPRPPLATTSGISITYTESGDTTAYSNTVGTSTYSADTVSSPGRIVLKYGYSWPSVSLETNNPIKVTYIGGYGTTRSDVPEPIRQGILITVAELYENREDTIFNLNVNHVNWLKRLLSPYQNWWPM